MKSKREIEFIINPVAGTQSKLLFENLIKTQLDLSKFTYTISYTQAQGHAFELASKAVARGTEYVIAVGGDGTVNETARALIHEETSLGIIPFGSGNGLARHLKIPLKPSLAVGLLNKENTKLIDAGKANGKPFFCTAGIGFDAHVGKMFALSGERGFKTYVKTVLKEFLKYSVETYSISIDGKDKIEKRAFSISFANASQFGNNAYISPLADISDGKLDLCLIEKYPRRLGWHMGLRLFNKTIHKSRFMQIFPITEAKVTCSEAGCFHLDGESLPLNGELLIEVVPGCLKVLVP